MNEFEGLHYVRIFLKDGTSQTAYCAEIDLYTHGQYGKGWEMYLFEMIDGEICERMKYNPYLDKYEQERWFFPFSKIERLAISNYDPSKFNKSKQQTDGHCNPTPSTDESVRA